MLAQENEVILTKTTGVTGSSKSSIVAINWALGKLDVAESLYGPVVIVRDGASKDRVFRPGSPPQLQIVTSPSTSQ
jgi:hypothetical protein